MTEMSIVERFQDVLERIEKAAQKAGRRAEEISLVVVTKSQPEARIEQVVAAGAKALGENYLDEAVDKIEHFRQMMDIEWHMIGHVQSRKASGVVSYFNLVESVDSVKLARKLAQFAQVEGKVMPVYLQFNLSGESSKHGFAAWDERTWSSLLSEIKSILDMEALEVRGLMTLPPYFEQPEYARPYFIQLRRLRDYFRMNLQGVNLHELSMGMSGDFEVAIEEGATVVRIGTAIMGERIRSGSQL